MQVLNILNMVYTLLFFSSKCSLFLNSNVFGSCIIHILDIYSTNIGTEYFKHGIYSPFFSFSKCSLFHNSNVFFSCISHILYTGCAKIKKNNSGAKMVKSPNEIPKLQSILDQQGGKHVMQISISRNGEPWQWECWTPQ